MSLGFTQQDSWKIQDDRMTKKRGARLCVPRLRHCNSASDGQCWNERCEGSPKTARENGERYIKFVQNYTFFQRREIPIGLILTQPVIKCQSHLNKKIQTPFHSKDRSCERTCKQLTTLLKEDFPFRAFESHTF